MDDPKWLPDAKFVMRVHETLTETFAGSPDPVDPPGVRDNGLLESACARPLTGFADRLKYPNPLKQAAVLFHSLVQNHPFYNGNKRTALVTLLAHLHRQGRRVKPNDITDDLLYDFVCAVAENKVPGYVGRMENGKIINAIYEWLKFYSEEKTLRMSEMKTHEFFELCEELGASLKISGGYTYIFGYNGASIHVANHVKKLNHMQMKTYFKKLKLGGNDPNDTAKQQIKLYEHVLRRLAHT